MAQLGKEVEIKLRVRDVAAFRRRLRRLGFRLRQPRSLERNELFDTPGRRLLRRGCLLRLRRFRRERWLTFKKKIGSSGEFKVRAEAEARLSEAEPIRRFLAELEVRCVFRYEKFRTVWEGGRKWLGGRVMLDETPIGDFVELEGEPRWIRRAAAALGFGPEQFITQDYLALYRQWCRRHRRPVRNMLFPAP